MEPYTLSTNHYQSICSRILIQVPEAGALVVVSFPKRKGGSGFPAPVFAILPRAGWTSRAPPELQQLVRIDVDGHRDVFGEREFVERFADETAQAHDGFAADQNVETELAL